MTFQVGKIKLIYRNISTIYFTLNNPLNIHHFSIYSSTRHPLKNQFYLHHYTSIFFFPCTLILMTDCCIRFADHQFSYSIFAVVNLFIELEIFWKSTLYWHYFFIEYSKLISCANFSFRRATDDLVFDLCYIVCKDFFQACDLEDR